MIRCLSLQCSHCPHGFDQCLLHDLQLLSYCRHWRCSVFFCGPYTAERDECLPIEKPTPQEHATKVGTAHGGPRSLSVLSFLTGHAVAERYADWKQLHPGLVDLGTLTTADGFVSFVSFFGNG